MDYTRYQSQLTVLWQQRNGYLVLALSALLIALVSLTFNFYLANHARTILVPPQIDRPLAVSASEVSAEYLTEMTTFFAGLKLTVTPESADYQNTVLLRYIASDYYPTFKSALAAEQQRMANQDFSSVFYPSHIQTDISRLSAVISGDLYITVGNTHLPVQRVSYLLRYRYSNGQLMITQFQEVHSPGN